MSSGGTTPIARRRAAAFALVIAVGAASLSGCVLLPPMIDAGAHDSARSDVAEVVRYVFGEGDKTTIEYYAREVDEALGKYRSVHLIGYEAYPEPKGDELDREAPIGRLEFRIVVPSPGYGADDHVACFWSEFSKIGVVPDAEAAESAIVHDLDCPENPHDIRFPADSSPAHVVPAGTEAVVVEVLTSAPQDVTAEEIVAEVAERMPPPPDPSDVAYRPRAVVVDGDIGFAIGLGRNCLLVKRTAAGVEVVRPAPVRLEPGELGCLPDTALRPPEDLQPTH